MIDIKDEDDKVVLIQVDDCTLLFDDNQRGPIQRRHAKLAANWQTLANRIGECAVITASGIRGIVWPLPPRG